MGDRALAELAAQLGERLLATGQSLMSVESCTGGWVAQVLTSVPGSSQWFERGLVTYSNRAKTDLAGVDPSLLEQYGAVSEEVAAAMARGGLARSRANLSLAITGIAGPGGGSPEKPVGTVWFAWAGFPGMGLNQPETSIRRFLGGREAVRLQSVKCALEGALERLASAG
ncbi:MAG: CinA family protein [Pseudomonadota bacterium]|nr:CinA family protein [Pseudomonadota bacterium]